MVIRFRRRGRTCQAISAEIPISNWLPRLVFFTQNDRFSFLTPRGQAIRSLLTLDDPESEFLQTELKDLHGQLKSLDESIRQIETRPATEADLEAVTSALQRLDPIWEVLYPEEQCRVLELLVDEIDVGKTAVTVQFRADGIEQIATELEPIGERNGRANTQ